MKFAKKDVVLKKLSEHVIVWEYCTKGQRPPIDAAIAYVHGVLGPKTNLDFAELFYVLEGSLQVVLDDHTLILEKGDVGIIPSGRRHTLHGYHAKLFISCSPPFDATKVVFDSNPAVEMQNQTV